MSLMKGGAPDVLDQVQGMSAEEQRDMKNGMILLRLRRWWRLFCIAGFVITFLIGFVHEISKIHGIADVAALMLMWAISWGLAYAIILYIFLYFLAYRVLQIFFYLKDLFGGNKETRL